MFWPFTKWPFAPAPYDQRATPWNIPAQLVKLPFDLMRTSAYPSRPALYIPALAQPAESQPTFFLPRKPASAKNGVATSAIEALSSSERHIANLSRSALERNARGLPLQYDEAVALLQARLPAPFPTAQVQTPTGIYSVPNAPNPPCPAQQIAKLLPHGIGPEGAQVRAVVAKVAATAVMPPIARSMMRSR